MNFQPTASTLDQPFSVVAKLTPINNNSVFVLRNLFFDTDKYDLKPESAEELLQLVELMKMNPKMEVMITGHTDNQGAADYNVKLSENRAASVVAYLVKAGIASARLKWKGYGDSRPAAANDTEEGRAKNRRIELVILKAS
jgi:outer membrane protein OmpA-like peptidoglycan-associated protein